MDSSRTSVNDLAKACAHSADAAEWGEFLRRSMPLVSLVALRVCRMWTNSPSPTMVDDIAQEVFLKLCEQERRILKDFEPRGEDSFLALLRMVSASVANDHFRRLYSVKRGGKVVTSPLDEDTAPSLLASAHQTGQMQRSVLLAQLDQMLRAAPDAIGERDRAIFWLYYLQGFTAEEIAGMSGAGLSAKGVESALRRAANWLRGEMNKRRPDG
jgi:RNA polymerase sigma-70 factor (ECF subfamily)